MCTLLPCDLLTIPVCYRIIETNGSKAFIHAFKFVFVILCRFGIFVVFEVVFTFRIVCDRTVFIKNLCMVWRLAVVEPVTTPPGRSSANLQCPYLALLRLQLQLRLLQHDADAAVVDVGGSGVVFDDDGKCFCGC